MLRQPLILLFCYLLNMNLIKPRKFCNAKECELITQLRDKNPCIDNLANAGHTFQVVFIFPHTNGHDLIVRLKIYPLFVLQY